MIDTSLNGRSLIVTGAGSGIGRAVAVSAVARGADVTVVGRRESALAETAALAEEKGTGSVVVCPGDVADPSDTERVVQTAIERFGCVDGLVNNAGVAQFGSVSEADLDDLERMFAVHVAGPVRLIRGVIPSLRERRGAIVNVTSVGGALATPNRSFYGATKAAINHLTRSLAIELAPEIRVNAILPGPVDTPIYDDLGIDDTATEKLRRDLAAATPLRRFGESEEVAEWVCMMLGDAGAWVTGTLLPIDGGRCA